MDFFIAGIQCLKFLRKDSYRRMYMCGIAGYVSYENDFIEQRPLHENRVRKMGKTIVHRGPDDFDVYVGKHVAFAHTRLAVMDPARGKQPMRKVVDGKEYVIVYNGEIYNAGEIRTELVKLGYVFSTTSDTEVVLNGYIAYGKELVDKLNGIYSFVIWNERERTTFFCRDRLGVKPLFYTLRNGTFYFASEIKALFAGNAVEPIINKYGLCELFGIGPARVPGCGVFEQVYEVLPGHCGSFSDGGFVQHQYWKPKAVPVTDSYLEAVERVREILTDAIERQMVSDVPICTLLSGGLDSSVVSAVAAKYQQKKGIVLDTYSFDYTDNQENFRASSFQPEQDRPYVDKMVAAIGSNHIYLECAYEDLYDSLFEAVDAKDLPGMTDVDASLLYFAGKIKERHTVCLSGECADEIFGGYPWFRAEESFCINRFPWSRDLEFRKDVLESELCETLPLEEYVQSQYDRSLRAMSLLPEEAKIKQDQLFTMKQSDFAKINERQWKLMVERRERELSHLNMNWFMATLLERKDRMTMAKGLEVRVPFADHRLVEYLYQMPWNYKYYNQQVKSLLKDAMGSYLPNEVLYRKKCPYPKTYDPKFEALLKKNLKEVLSDSAAPITKLVNHEYLERLMRTTSDYGKPWFGQLMATPQMYAYLLQMNYWMQKYHVQLRL